MSALTERSRWQRALEEDIRLVPIDAATYLTLSASGNIYITDVKERWCSCPDYEFRGPISCKHLCAAVQREGAYA